MVDASLFLQEREKCEKNLYFKELWNRISNEASSAANTVAHGHTLEDRMVRFYQGKVAAFARMLLIPDEIIEDASKKEGTGELVI